ncbi:hypothetical protein ABBQ38_003478 [Trebouxia sp. C0009 RCD-2024]
MRGHLLAGDGPACFHCCAQPYSERLSCWLVQVVVITTVGCQYCKRAKDTLRTENVDFDEIEASNQLELLKQIRATTGQRTVPQIFLGGKLLGGSDDLLQLVADKQLHKLLEQAQGQAALPKDIQDAVHTASTSSHASWEAAFMPDGITKDDYIYLQQLATDMGAAVDNIQWTDKSSGVLSAAEALRWLTLCKALSHDEAKQALTRLQSTQNICVLHPANVDLGAGLHDADLSTLRLQLVSFAPLPKFGQPLNMHYSWFGRARGPSEVSEGLRQLILRLYDKHLTADGKALDYEALKRDPVFKTYAKATAELQKVEIAPLDREERMAFFINIYNAVVVHALAVFGPASNLQQRLTFFNSIKYNIGGQDYSANDMEHGVLRGNRPTPASPWVLLGVPQWSSGYFKATDPRAAYVVSPVDPRIHFALVCGAKSCPPIKVYTPATLQEGLDSATSAFCEGEVIVHKEAKTVELSKIFKWYKQDFGPPHQLFPWLLPYLPPSAKADLQELLNTVGSKHIKVKYRHYDWALNSPE